MNEQLPRTVLICHEGDRLDAQGLASWLAATTNLVGMVVIRDEPSRLWRAVRKEIRRGGWVGFVDVIAFQLYYQSMLARRDARWRERQIHRLCTRYPADLESVPRLVVGNPNSDECRTFMSGLNPDLAIARCKFILKPAVFNIPKRGTYVLHPGICPEYRNAHGCFWALAQRDMNRVGMTLLKVDEGVDTGPVYLHATYNMDELRESHAVIQSRVVLENLDAIASALRALGRGEKLTPIPTEGRRSATWGHPRFSAYLRWKLAARRNDYDANRIPSLS